jgi:hypothetical protein
MMKQCFKSKLIRTTCLNGSKAANKRINDRTNKNEIVYTKFAEGTVPQSKLIVISGGQK